MLAEGLGKTMAPEYLGELARQFGFLSAFLGGVAATFVAQLLTLNSPRKAVAWTLVLAAAAAVAFIVSVLGSTLTVAAVHPQAPEGLKPYASDPLVRATGSLSMVLGLYLLLATVGLAGWVRSRKAGIATTALAITGAVCGGWTLVGF